jgi:glutamate/tyrosine decarboxylase-like PLP-dependent enzyme
MDTWDWTPEELKRVGYAVVDLIAEHISALPGGPVFRPVPREVAEGLVQAPPPAGGENIDSILAEFTEKIAAYPMGNGHPRFFAWVNSPPTPAGVFADALASALGPSVAGGNHAAVWVEHAVLGWFRQLLGLPANSAGLLVSGGSMANLTGLAVARHVKSGIDVRADGLQGIDRPLTLYMGEEGHGCIRKAAELLGIGSKYIRTIPSDERLRMDLRLLEEAIRADLDAGLRPIAVVASAGTVNSGAIDPLAQISEVCRQYDLWLHVDGAYGAPGILSEQYRPQLEALSLADSVALDPHKWLYLPVEAGLVMVREGAAMRDAFSLVPPYLRTDGNPHGVGGPPWFSEYGFQQTRGFRALKVWMALKYHGLEGYTASIERDIALAQRLARLVETSVDLDLLAPQSLSIVLFRFAPPGINEEQLDALNKSILEDIQLSGKAFLSSTLVRGRFALRACVVNHRTSAGDIDFLVRLVEETGRRLSIVETAS